MGAAAFKLRDASPLRNEKAGTPRKIGPSYPFVTRSKQLRSAVETASERWTFTFGGRMVPVAFWAAFRASLEGLLCVSYRLQPGFSPSLASRTS